MKAYKALQSEIVAQQLPTMSQEEWLTCFSYMRNLDSVNKIELYQKLKDSEYLSKVFQTLSMASQSYVAQHLMYKLPTRVIDYYVCFRSLSTNQEWSVYQWIAHETTRLQEATTESDTPIHDLFQNIKKLRSWMLNMKTYEPHVAVEPANLLIAVCIGLVNLYDAPKINTAIEFWITQDHFTEIHEFVEMVDRSELYSDYPTAWAMHLALTSSSNDHKSIESIYNERL